MKGEAEWNAMKEGEKKVRKKKGTWEGGALAKGTNLTNKRCTKR